MARDIQKETINGRGVRHSRDQVLERARQATETDPVSVVTYTPVEAEKRARQARNAQALYDAIHSSELRALRRKWARENARQREIRLGVERLAKAVIRAGWLEHPEIVTSAPELAPANEAPFPLSRRVLRSKIAPKRRRVSAIGNFFRVVSISLC